MGVIDGEIFDWWFENYNIQVVFKPYLWKSMDSIYQHTVGISPFTNGHGWIGKCASVDYTVINSDDGSPVLHKATVWNNAGWLLIIF